ncbi:MULTISPECIES: hypothetical protein [Microvirga]|uniref:hypothetical protein n=1 Tax=Microvirga TaxID=186650 RepID=UPI0021C6B275|nr:MULTISPECIES: hypothetical protein [unclassified Microvirga]
MHHGLGHEIVEHDVRVGLEEQGEVKADIVVTDSRRQAGSRGELGRAYDPDAVLSRVLEIGEIVMGTAQGRAMLKHRT